MIAKSPQTLPAPPLATGTLAPDFILDLKEQLELKEWQLARLPEEIAELRKRYEAALLFAPKGFNPDADTATQTPVMVPLESLAPSEAVPQQKALDLKPKKTRATKVKPKSNANARPSWASAVRLMLDGATEGMTHKELLGAIRLVHDFPQSNGEKGFYNAVARLLKDGGGVKHAGRLYSAKVVAAIRKYGGELPQAPEVARRAGGSASLIVGILQQHSDGLTAINLRKVLQEMPDAPRSLTHHGQYVYNVLGTLIGAGTVVKNGSLYRLTPDKERKQAA
jgi:hypothetical protein